MARKKNGAKKNGRDCPPLMVTDPVVKSEMPGCSFADRLRATRFLQSAKRTGLGRKNFRTRTKATPKRQKDMILSKLRNLVVRQG